MIAKLELEKFAKFGELNINFSPKINIIIGENGTGKTQLLKAAYVANSILGSAQEQADLTEKLCATFRPAGESLGKLVKNGTPGGQHAKINAEFGLGQRLSAEFTATSKKVRLIHFSNEVGVLGSPIFLPTKEVLSLLKGITSGNSDKATLHSLFDSTYFDLCEKLSAKKSLKLEDSIEGDPRFWHTYKMLVNKIGGRFRTYLGLTRFESGSYQEQHTKDQHPLSSRIETKFTPDKDESVSVQMAAEGIRKLGILQLLLENKQLNPGTSGTLFWDEPETNMNPKLLRVMVEILLELARNGQQIVLATHDYVLLKWFDLLADKGKEDHVLFHSLYWDHELKQINSASTDSYQDISHNAIDEAFGFILDQEIQKEMGGLGR